MSDSQLRFELSSGELAFLKQLAIREQSFEHLFSEQQPTAGIKYVIALGRADAEELRGRLTELLAQVGFASNYQPNEQGRMLEGLIDKLYCP